MPKPCVQIPWCDGSSYACTTGFHPPVPQQQTLRYQSQGDGTFTIDGLSFGCSYRSFDFGSVAFNLPLVR